MASSEEKPKAAQSEKKPALKRHNNPFVYFGTIILLVIVVVTFIFVPGIGNMSGSDGKVLSFGTWDGKPISFTEGSYFARQVQSIKANLESQGYKDSGDQFFAYQVWRQAFEETVKHTAFLSYAKESGITVTSDYLDEQMTMDPNFIEDGVFSRRRFREASNGEKLAIRAAIKEGALKNQYVAGSTEVIPSAAEKAFIKAMATDVRLIQYVAFPLNAYPEAEKLAFAAANPASFRRVKLSRITTTTNEKDANDLRSRIVSGSVTFENAAKDTSKDAYAAQGGNVGWRYLWELKGDFEKTENAEAVMGTAKGEITPAYKTVTGSWIFFRIDEAASDADLNDPTYLTSVTEYMNRYEKGRIEDWVTVQAKAFASDAAADFAKAATGRNLAAKTLEPFPLNYGNAFNLGYFSLLGSMNTQNTPELASAPSDEKFLQTVFSLNAGAVSEPLVLGENVIVLQVKEISKVDESKTSLIEAYYPIVLQDALAKELSAWVMKSPRLKDDFMTMFFQVFSPAQ